VNGQKLVTLAHPLIFLPWYSSTLTYPFLPSLPPSLPPSNHRQRSGEFQCLVISLKDMFYENANALVGVCR
jgi:hypothetical protein